MPAAVYPAFVTGDRESGYLAKFPDLAGCTANAAQQTSLIVVAREALRQRLNQLAAEGEEWPEASEISALTEHPDAKGASVVLVDVDMEDAPVRVNISIGERLLKRIDQAAEGRGMTRSGFIAAAARQSLGEGPFLRWDTKKVEETVTDYSNKIGEKFGPGSEFHRGWNELDRKITKYAENFAEQIAQALRNKAPPPYGARGTEPPPAKDASPSADDPSRSV
jgi:predicted RNase H-like HicB family nuclease